MNFLIRPITQVLIFLYGLLGNNFGLAIIALTLLIRTILVPITLPSLRSAKKMQELKPQLDKLKKKHQDKVKQQQAQLDLYKKHGVNPASGCLPQIVQIIILIALYRVFINFIDQGTINGASIQMNFLWLDLSQSDPYYILPVFAGLAQFLYAYMMRTGLEQDVESPQDKKAKQEEEDSLEMAQSIQQQMVFLMPVMTVIIASRFPSGLALYWAITTLFSFVQQLIVSGPGGLITAKNQLLAKLNLTQNHE